MVWVFIQCQTMTQRMVYGKMVNVLNGLMPLKCKLSSKEKSITLSNSINLRVLISLMKILHFKCPRDSIKDLER